MNTLILVLHRDKLPQMETQLRGLGFRFSYRYEYTRFNDQQYSVLMVMPGFNGFEVLFHLLNHIGKSQINFDDCKAGIVDCKTYQPLKELTTNSINEGTIQGKTFLRQLLKVYTLPEGEEYQNQHLLTIAPHCHELSFTLNKMQQYQKQQRLANQSFARRAMRNVRHIFGCLV